MKTTRLLVVLLATMLFYSCKSSEIIQDVWRFRTYNFVHPYSDLQMYDYKGKVKSVKETSYSTLNRNGNVVPDTIMIQMHLEFNRNGYWTYIHYFDVNTNGLFGLKHRPYILNNTLTYEESKRRITINRYEGDKLVERRVKQFNSKGQPTRIETYSADGDLHSLFKYKYDRHGHLIREVTKDYRSRITRRIYDIEYDQYGFPGKYTHRTISEFKDKDEIAIYEMVHDEQGHLLYEKETIDGEISGIETQSYKDGKLSSYTSTRFYGRDDIVKREGKYYPNYMEWTTLVKDEETIHRLEFEYDTKGNIIKKTQFKNGEPTSVTITEFEYYE